MTAEQTARVKAAVEELAAVATEVQWNGDETAKDECTFVYLDISLIALCKALKLNGVRVDW